MEYTIRCDVESVNTDNLAQEFRNENCVYPRACCAKDSYKGNRLQYENECNTCVQREGSFRELWTVGGTAIKTLDYVVDE